MTAKDRESPLIILVFMDGYVEFFLLLKLDSGYYYLQLNKSEKSSISQQDYAFKY